MIYIMKLKLQLNAYLECCIMWTIQAGVEHNQRITCVNFIEANSWPMLNGKHCSNYKKTHNL